MDTCALNVFRMRVQAEAASATAELARCEQAFASADAAYEAEMHSPCRPGVIPTDEQWNRFQTILNAAIDAREKLTAAQHRAEAASRMLAKVRMLYRCALAEPHSEASVGSVAASSSGLES